MVDVLPTKMNNVCYNISLDLYRSLYSLTVQTLHCQETEKALGKKFGNYLIIPTCNVCLSRWGARQSHILQILWSSRDAMSLIQPLCMRSSDPTSQLWVRSLILWLQGMWRRSAMIPEGLVSVQLFLKCYF